MNEALPGNISDEERMGLTMKQIRIYVAVCLLAIFPQFVYADSRIEKARALFARYIELEKKFDPSVVELYSDDCLIQNTQRYTDGQVKVIVIPVDKYKSLVHSVMPIAKSLNDINTYSKIKYTIEGENVRIQASRYSHRKKYTSPISMLVGQSETGEWLILEDISESQP